MNILLRRNLAVIGLLVALATFAMAPMSAFATESHGGERTKITIPEDPHDKVGLILLGFMGLAAAAMTMNIVQQLGGKRDQADGGWRWR